jgi:hypothetical protein
MSTSLVQIEAGAGVECPVISGCSFIYAPRGQAGEYAHL